ncbi:MAG: FIST C-terminal domain-containing protein [Coriobacteriia bacterium]|nr:FIST C-terminal domain-containing protein [Coriobacteriia bacterium]
MIRATTVYTKLLDGPDAALKEIKEQLATFDLMKNSVGIVSCHYEFILSGVHQAVCSALPFSTVGVISNFSCTEDSPDSLQFSILVMTSDDARFETLLTEPLLEDPKQPIRDLYAHRDSEAPAMAFLYGAFLPQNVGDDYTDALTEVLPNVPVFGSLAVDDTADFGYSFMLYDGQYYRDRLAILHIYGDIRPSFALASISEDRLLGREALITRSEGHVLKEINGRPVTEFFTKLGLDKMSGITYALISLPFMVNYNDGTPPVSKVFVSLTEEGYARCAGAMPEGATLSVGVFDRNDVIATTTKAVDTIANVAEKPSVVIAHSCVSRSMTLGTDMLREYEIMKDLLDDIPFLVTGSGGEYCSILLEDGRAINRFHNNTIILCAL